ANIQGSKADPVAQHVERTVKKLFADFNTGAVLPSSEARKQILELAALGSRGQAMVPLVEASLKRMHDKGQFTSAEFAELAQAMLAVEPDAPAQAVAAYLREPRYDAKLFPTNKLLAFGKPALPAVADGMALEFPPTS